MESNQSLNHCGGEEREGKEEKGRKENASKKIIMIIIIFSRKTNHKRRGNLQLTVEDSFEGLDSEIQFSYPVQILRFMIKKGEKKKDKEKKNENQ